MEDNVKIQNLMKKSLYQEARRIAVSSKFPPEIIAEIHKEYADKLYQQKSYDQAVKEYCETIGHLNPSYVIQRFIQVPQLDNLIMYLKKLISSPDQQQQTLSQI